MFHPIDNQLLHVEPMVLAVGCDAATCQMLKVALRPLDLRVEHYASMEAFLEACEPTRPGCAFLDLGLVGVGLQDVFRQMSDRWVYLPVVLLADRRATTPGDVAEAVRAVRSGAFDFLPKPWSLERLAEAAKEALQWEADHHEAIVDRVRIRRRLARLDQRERQVLELIVQGTSSVAISSCLGLGFRTVEACRSSLTKKMRAKSLADLLRQAITASH